MKTFTRAFLLMAFSFSLNHSFGQAWTWVANSNFRVHYMETGTNAVDLTDNNSNGVPDYVEQVLNSLNTAYDIYINQLNFAKPPYDTGGRYNIYLLDFTTIGLSATVLGDTRKRDSIGDNPNTTASETFSYTGYVLLRSTYTGLSSLPYSEAELICINACHEFFHLVQHGYNGRLSGFIKESQAMRMGDKLCGTDFGVTQHLGGFFNNPDIALNYDRTDEGTTQHHYSSWIFWKFMEEHTDTAIIRHFLENSIYATDKSGEIIALENALSAKGTNLINVFRNFCLANFVFSSSNASYPEYTYQDAAHYIVKGLLGSTYESTFSYTGSAILYKSIDHNKRLMRLSSDNFFITSNRKFSVKVRPEHQNDPIEFIFLKWRTSDHVYEVEFPGSRTLNNVQEFWINVPDPGDYDGYGIIVKRFDKLVTDTASLQYEIEIGAPDPWTVYDISPYSVAGYDNANDIDVDPATGNVWVTGGAILKFDNRWHTIRDPYPYGALWAGWAKCNSKDWFGYDNGGFTKYAGGFTDYTFNYDTNIIPHTAEIVSDGSALWKAGGQVVKLDAGLSATNWGVNEGLPTDNTSDIALSPADGSIWVSSDKGVGKHTAGGWSWYNTSAGLPDNTTLCIDISPTGIPWVGMPFGKIAKYISGTFQEVVNPNVPGGCGLPCNVSDVKLVSDDHLWLGMYGGGATYYDGATWRQFDNVNTGIPEMYRVTKIALEGDSCAWFAMESKVARFCYKNLFSGIAEAIKTGNNEAVTIYPNPAADVIHLLSEKGIISAEVMDVTGKKIMEEKIIRNELNTAVLSPGIYLVKILLNDNSVEVKKLVKN